MMLTDLENHILKLHTAAVKATHLKEKGQEHVAEMEGGQEKNQNVRPHIICYDHNIVGLGMII